MSIGIRWKKEGTWVDHIFIQMTAWYMTLDITILTTSSKPENPFIIIKGKENDAGSGPPLILGNYTNIHYQSLLPKQGVTYSSKGEELSKSQEKQKETHSSKDNITTKTNEQQTSIYATHQLEPVTSKEKKISIPLPERKTTSKSSHQGAKI